MTALLLALLLAAPERVVVVAKPTAPPGVFSRVRGSLGRAIERLYRREGGEAARGAALPAPGHPGGAPRGDERARARLPAEYPIALGRAESRSPRRRKAMRRASGSNRRRRIPELASSSRARRSSARIRPPRSKARASRSRGRARRRTRNPWIAARRNDCWTRCAPAKRICRLGDSPRRRRM